MIPPCLLYLKISFSGGHNLVNKMIAHRLLGHSEICQWSSWSETLFVVWVCMASLNFGSLPEYKIN